MKKLTNANEILAWAYDVREHEDCLFAEDPPHAGDRATTERLARAMRVLDAAESVGPEQTHDVLGQVVQAALGRKSRRYAGYILRCPRCAALDNDAGEGI